MQYVLIGVNIKLQPVRQRSGRVDRHTTFKLIYNIFVHCHCDRSAAIQPNYHEPLYCTYGSPRRIFDPLAMTEGIYVSRGFVLSLRAQRGNPTLL